MFLLETTILLKENNQYKITIFKHTISVKHLIPFFIKLRSMMSRRFLLRMVTSDFNRILIFVLTLIKRFSAWCFGDTSNHGDAPCHRTKSSITRCAEGFAQKATEKIVPRCWLRESLHCVLLNTGTQNGYPGEETESV